MDRFPHPPTPLPKLRRSVLLLLLFACSSLLVRLQAQDIFGEANKAPGDRTRVAVAGFKPAATGTDTLKTTFDTTLYNDLSNAGIFDMVSKSIAPPITPGSPAEMKLDQWSPAPVAAAMVAFGSLGVTGGKLVINGYLFDVKNPQYPQILAQQYNEDATEDSARQVAHRFADQIILRLGGGIPGICETKIYYVHASGSGLKMTKEIWEMDYDGANQHPITHLGKIALSPRISPDNNRLAFSTLDTDGNKIGMYSLLTSKIIGFRTVAGSTITPAWAPSGNEIAYSAAPGGDFDIWVSDVNGSLPRKITNFKGPDMSPVYNPRTGSQIAWISGRTGLPQLYIMESDGSGVQQLTDGGYVSAPSWSPNGQFLAFGWNRKYGPGAPGGQDIYVMEIATKKWTQITHDTGQQGDFPSWSPDGRVDHMRIYSMLADGTERKPLTGPGNDMPNWSWK